MDPRPRGLLQAGREADTSALHPLPESLAWLALEHDLAEVLAKQREFGWAFDERAAYELESEIRLEAEALQREIIQRHPFTPHCTFTPKRGNKIKGYVPGAEFTKIVDFNPTSRDHIAWFLEQEGVKLKEKTDTGKWQIDESSLKKIDNPFAEKFFRLLELSKFLGLLSEGRNAWLKQVRKGRIHHWCLVSTNTHRCAHRNPNLAQVPSDPRFRKLFIASPGNVLVGADLQAIELRMLGHYLSRYDGGRYCEILLNDDIHQVNADKIGISRRDVKTVTYAFLYGAGDEKVGLSIDPTLKPNKAKQLGKQVKADFIAAIDGLESLVNAVKTAAERNGSIRSLDGRRIPVSSSHKALNYLLQSSAGVVAKRWVVLSNSNSFVYDGYATQVGFIHDEVVFDCRPEAQAELPLLIENSAALAGEFYSLKIPIEASASVGTSWADIH
jgi:DNA polymerase I-like protein with 3'-5' exonuclease and polymerase domains